MRLKRLFCMALACMFVIGSAIVPVDAVETRTTTPVSTMNYFVEPRATESFSITIPAKTKLSANTSFPLAAGETVTIKASYAPFSASVDFGLIAPNGVYYYFNITNGSIDKTIQVNESGDYTLQIRNNADIEVKVAGFVNY